MSDIPWDKPNGKCSHCAGMLNQWLMSVTVMREDVIKTWEEAYGNQFHNRIWSNSICFAWNEI